MTNSREGLVADIGGTNARLGIAIGLDAPVRSVRFYACADYDDFNTLVDAYLKDSGEPMPRRACLAIAGPVSNNKARLTNGPWAIDGDQFCRKANMERCELVNDFTALAYALPWLTREDVTLLQPGAKTDDGVRLVIGPGTGLGVSALIQQRGQRVALASEGGHVGFAPADETEIEIYRWFSSQYERVSIERILSGGGLEQLHSALLHIEGKTADAQFEGLSAPQIVERGLADPTDPCRKTLDCFLGLLGAFAGDLTLVMGAHSVHIGGGIVPRIKELLPSSPFLKRFAAKGRYQNHLSTLKTSLITTKTPALTGTTAWLFDPGLIGSMSDGK